MNQVATLYPESLIRISTRTLLSMVIASAFTFGLFVLMHLMTKQEGRPTVSQATPVIIDPVFQAPDETLIENTRVEPPPKVQKLPELPREVPEDPIAPNGSHFTVNIPTAPVVKISGPDTFGNMDSELRPIVRADPKYPADAARDGIEGWVKLSYDVDHTGSVTNVDVIDAQPKRRFDKAAKQALTRWKYQPRKENGVTVYQAGLTVVLEFTLDNQ